MITIFAFFTKYEEAGAAVRNLVHEGIAFEEFNAIVQDYVVKDKMGPVGGKANVVVTEIPDGLDKMLGGHRSETVRDAGVVLTAGQLAGEVVSLATSSGGTAAGLGGALEIMGVPAGKAERYAAGIRGGGVLVFVRTVEEKASQVSSVFAAHHGQDFAAAGRRAAPA
jgi:hypothetical protein